MKTGVLINKIIGLFNLKLVRKKKKKETIKLERRDILQEVEDLLDKIDLQKKRIIMQKALFLKSLKNNPNNRRQNLMSHDADFYFILSNRAYRYIKLLSQKENKVANLKDKNSSLLSKLKIRHVSEHWQGWDKLPRIYPNTHIKSRGSFIINKGSLVIHSGEFKWDFYKDHPDFMQVLNEMLEIVKQSTTDTYLFEKHRRF